ncbi:MAG: hypothetical protein ACYCY5_03825 [Sulfuricella sp.]
MKLRPALKKHAIPIALGVAMLLVFLPHAAKLVNIPLIQRIEAISYDARLGLAGQVEKAVLDEIELFHQAVKLYRAQDWALAEVQLLNLQKASPECPLYRL